MVRVKICGITNSSDAQAAVLYGADALGFIFCKSLRKVSVAQAKEISLVAGPWVATVGVFMDQPVEEVLKVARELRLTAIQLHGKEKESYAKKLAPFKVIKAFHVDKRFDFSEIRDYPADAFLFDTKVAGKPGGTGKAFDWKILKGITFRKPVILSGGLNVQNVKRAVDMTLPYGVDVSSSIESVPGKKNPELVKEFIANAKAITK